MNPEKNPPSPTDHNNPIDPNNQDQNLTERMFNALDHLVNIHRTNISATNQAVETRLGPLVLSHL